MLSVGSRASSLAHVNSMLREQLDQATSANQQLTQDIHKISQDLQHSRVELEAKENEWRDEEQVSVRGTKKVRLNYRSISDRSFRLLCLFDLYSLIDHT